jgi:hypothetical protein
LCPSVQVLLHFDKIFSVTGKHCPHFCHLKTKLDWKAFFPSQLLCKVNGSKNEIWRFVSHKKIAKCIPKLILLMRYQVTVNNKLSLHLRRTLIYNSTFQRQLARVCFKVTWLARFTRFLTLLYNVCIMNLDKLIGLELSINIWIWVAWLFDRTIHCLLVQVLFTD